MANCRDLATNLRAGQDFLVKHGLPHPKYAPNDLVLVGFDDCDPAQLNHEPSLRDPELRLEHAYHFSEGADGNQFLADGFSIAENWGRWTDDKNAFLFFTLATVPQTPISLVVEADSISLEADRRQVASVVANDHACGQLVVTRRQTRAAVTCPAGAFRVGSNMVRLDIASPTRPIDIGENGDSRHLGLGLKTLTFTAKE